LRKHSPDSVVIGWTKDTSLRQALEAAAIHEGFAEISLAVAGADLIYMALPVGQTIELLPEIARLASPMLWSPMRRAPSDRSAGGGGFFPRGSAHFLGDIQWQGKKSPGSRSRGGIVSWIEIRVDPHGGRKTQERYSIRALRNLSRDREAGRGTIWMNAETHDRAAASSRIFHNSWLSPGRCGARTDGQTGLPVTLSAAAYATLYV